MSRHYLARAGRTAILLCAAVLFSAPAFAQFIQDGNKLIGTLNVGASAQGSSIGVSADGNTMLAGGYADNTDFGAAPPRSGRQ